MIELSNERIDEILHNETKKTEESVTILRAVYTRYMRMYEKFFADIDKLDDEAIARLKKDHEETQSFIKYYYMDIPLDICTGIIEFDDNYTAKLLGPDWHKHLFDAYNDFKKTGKNKNKSEESVKTEFVEENLSAFYSVMDYIFRDGFGTGSKTAENMLSSAAGILFGE